MGRNNRVLRSIFSEIFRGDETSIDEFLKIDGLLSIDDSTFTPIKGIYKRIFKDVEDKVKILSLIEELIIQLRCQMTFKENLKIYYVNDYLYARSVFYRQDKEAKDIRVPIGKGSSLPDHRLPRLEKNKAFMAMVENKVGGAIEKEIKITKERLSTVLEIHKSIMNI